MLDELQTCSYNKGTNYKNGVLEEMNGLKRIRKEKGLTQKELATRVGVTQNAISCYELGTRFPRGKVLYLLAQVLGCDVRELF